MKLGGGVESHDAVCHGGHVEAGPLQRVLDGLADDRIVLDDQDVCHVDLLEGIGRSLVDRSPACGAHIMARVFLRGKAFYKAFTPVFQS